MTRRAAWACAVAFAVLGAAPGSSTATAAEGPSAKAGPGGAENGALPPLSSDELTERARRLFDAIAQDEPERPDDFFFPREPFLRLKDVADPGRYHAELLRAYHRDVHLLHAGRRTWEGARFVSFELGSTPRWVEPGEEWNEIGYHRTFGAKLRYELLGKVRTLDVHTIISWDGRWYVTHLRRIHR